MVKLVDFAQKAFNCLDSSSKQPISAFTIRRNLKKVGLSARIPRRKPAMTEAHRQARLEWAM